MEFKTMADVDAWREQEAKLRRLRWEANELCNVLCGKLDWWHEPEREQRIRHALARARVRLARREAYSQ